LPIEKRKNNTMMRFIELRFRDTENTILL